MQAIATESAMAETPDNPAGWLTTNDVAELAHCSVDTVNRAINAGDITGARKWGVAWLIPLQAGITWAGKYKPYEGLRKKE